VSDLDLSGDWTGVYSYPRGLSPVSFAALMRDAGGALSGNIEEEAAIDGRAPRLRSAALEGRRAGFATTWLKTYEHRDVSHDVVYEGEVSLDGQEIGGRWSIVGSWSGSFLMVRNAVLAKARERRARVGR
jgi:hypothetical protein